MCLSCGFYGTPRLKSCPPLLLIFVCLVWLFLLFCSFRQLARVADRVRRMPLHSPLAAVLAGVELTLRKAQDWEQHAHRGVSLKDELRSLSALVVRWRAVELKSWPQLLDAREGAFVLKVNTIKSKSIEFV